MRPPDFLKYEIISFDVFDTLIMRLVSRPIDVFEIVERRAKSIGLDADGFASLRVAAEKAARFHILPEVTLDDIYSELVTIYPCYVSLAEKLKYIELQVEKDVCVARPLGARLYEDALASGARIVITTDTYLPEYFMNELLGRCGYTGFQQLFVSSCCHATKADGSIYKLLLAKHGISAGKVLHIGDNPKSDIVRARINGIAAFRMPCRRHQTANLVESFLVASTEIRDEFGKSLEDIGYSCLGPVLVGFCLWLHKELASAGIRKVYYLSRDGLIIKKAMETLNLDIFDSVYLYGSRRAFQIPSYALLESFEEILDAMFLPRNVSLTRVFSKMGLDQTYIEETLESMGIDPFVERPATTLANDEDAIRSYAALHKDVVLYSRHELSLLEQYLRQNDFSGKLAIVDIGWFGNMQAALERVTNAMKTNADIHGYYVGLNPHGKHQMTHQMKGYLFDACHDDALYERERSFNMIFETLFSAPHGTTRGYQEKDGKVVPILAPYDGIEEKVGEEAERCRLGALDFAADFKRVLGANGLTMAPQKALSNMDRVGNSPSLAEAIFFGNWAMESDGEIVCAAQPRNMAWYMSHPKALALDFEHTPWKVGFLKRLLKLPLPYGDIWTAMHTVYSYHKMAGKCK
ncbi:MAG TPA: hypothetical protein DCP66_07115 [Collinsella sp.]|nr:hypothetical protein [Collinsella sp.]